MDMDNYTGRFIMFSVITNIYNKKTKGPTLMELFTATGKLKTFFLTTSYVRCVPCPPWCTHRTSLVVKNIFFSFPVAVNNSIKVGPLVFLLQMFVITEKIMYYVCLISKLYHAACKKSNTESIRWQVEEY